MAPDLMSPIRHFQADSRFNKNKSASVVQRMVGYRILQATGWEGHSATYFTQVDQRMCPGKKIVQKISSQIRKKFEWRPAHTTPGGAVCRGGRQILWAPAVSGRNVTGRQADTLSTCCERQKRDRAAGRYFEHLLWAAETWQGGRQILWAPAMSGRNVTEWCFV